MRVYNIRERIRIQYGIDCLYKNSFILMLDSAFAAILGFIFIKVVTGLYSVEDIGLYSAIVSTASLLSILSMLGLDIGLIRFLSGSKEPKNLINSCFTLSSIVAILVSSIFLVSIDLWSPALAFIRSDTKFTLLFLMVTVFVVILNLQTNIFVGKRSTEYLLIRNGINNILKIMLVIFLVGVGLFGILSAYAIGILISIFIAFLFIIKLESGYFPKLAIKKVVICNILRFSIGNYIASLLGTGSTLALPLLVVNVLGAEEAAYFYIDWTLYNFILAISGSISTSLFAEGSNDPRGVYSNAGRSLKLTYLLLVPIVLLILIFGRELLMIFGPKYSQNAYSLLSILTVSTLISSYNVITYNIRLVEKDIKFIILYTGVSGLGMVFLSYPFMHSMGLIGIGLSRILIQGVLLLALLLLIHRKPGSNSLTFV